MMHFRGSQQSRLEYLTELDDIPVPVLPKFPPPFLVLVQTLEFSPDGWNLLQKLVQQGSEHANLCVL